MNNAPLQLANDDSLSADDQRQLRDRTGELEEAVEMTRGVLTAIRTGGLLDAAPADPADYERHSAATALLQLLEGRLDALAA